MRYPIRERYSIDWAGQTNEHHASMLLINTDLGTAVEAVYNQINEYSDLQIAGDRVNLKYD